MALKAVKFLVSYDVYTVGEVAGFEARYAKQLVDENIAEFYKEKGKRSKLSETEKEDILESRKLDFAKTQSFIKSELGQHVQTPEEAVDIIKKSL